MQDGRIGPNIWFCRVRYKVKGNTVLAAERAKVNPRIRLAARLYATGAMPTKKAAAEAAGVHPVWFTVMSNHNDLTKRIMSDVDRAVEDESISTSQLLQHLGRKAIGKIHTLMNTAVKDEVQLKAAMDLADRNPETSKIQRHQVEALHITSSDAKELAASLVQAAQVTAKLGDAMKGDFVKVDSSIPDVAMIPVAGPRLVKDEEDLGTEVVDPSQHEAPEVK